jgi:hypothetical protein
MDFYDEAMKEAECPLCGEPVDGDQYEGYCTNGDCDYWYETDYSLYRK